jgi:DNA-binding transcriptional regulator GbsR (MarR family)
MLRSTKHATYVDYAAIAYIIDKNKTAGIIMMSVLDRYRGGSIYISANSLSNKTGVNKGNLSKAIKVLEDEYFIQKDPQGSLKGLFFVNANVIRDYEPRAHRDIGYDVPLRHKIGSLSEEPTPSQSAIREVKRMNKLTDEDIADAVFS